MTATISICTQHPLTSLGLALGPHKTSAVWGSMNNPGSLRGQKEVLRGQKQ